MSGLAHFVSQADAPPAYCSLFVPGVPRPGGSKSAFPFVREVARLPKRDDIATLFAFRSYLRQNCPMSVTMSDSGKHTAAWRKAVVRAAKEAGIPAPEAGHSYFTLFEFRMPRPADHFSLKGGVPSGLKPWAVDLVPSVMPDVRKLGRAVEDALTGIVWPDDGAVVCSLDRKVYPAFGEAVGVLVAVWRDVEFEAVVLRQGLCSLLAGTRNPNAIVAQ